MRNPIVEINGIGLFEKYKAVLAERHSVQPPEPKARYQDIPGGDGSADLSTAIAGRITYNRREITMNFASEHKSNEWGRVFSEILRDFHGKEGKIIFGDDPSYYYVGRMQVSGYERERTYGKFTITVNAEPYKYDRVSSLEPWLWDSFSFRNGIIRNYKDIQVNGTKTLNIIGSDLCVIPVFIVEGNLTVSFHGKTYQLKTGKNKIYSIVVEQGTETLIFQGTGKVSVDYRGGKL